MCFRRLWVLWLCAECCSCTPQICDVNVYLLQIASNTCTIVHTARRVLFGIFCFFFQFRHLSLSNRSTQQLSVCTHHIATEHTHTHACAHKCQTEWNTATHWMTVSVRVYQCLLCILLSPKWYWQRRASEVPHLKHLATCSSGVW